MITAYAFALQDEATDELSYANTVFDKGEMIYAANGRLGFGALVHGAAIAMHRLMTHLVLHSIKDANVYTNNKELLDRVLSPLTRDELIREVKAFGVPFGIRIEHNDETRQTYDLFTVSFSIFDT